MRRVIRIVSFPLRRWPRWFIAAFGAAALLMLALAAANAYVLLRGDGEVTGRVAQVPPAEVAIVPGALVKPSGR